MRELPEMKQQTRTICEQIARLNLQTGACVDGIFDAISEMQGAADRSDWIEVQRLAHLILMDALVYGMNDLAEAVIQIKDEIGGPAVVRRGPDATNREDRRITLGTRPPFSRRRARLD